MPKLTISLVTFNGEKLLPYCLQSIRAQIFQDFELVVFDNHSTDETCEVVARLYPGARMIAPEKNVGFAAGHNAVIAQSTAPYLCVLNQDVFLEPDYFLLCIEQMDASAQFGAIQGKILRVKELTQSPHSDTIDTCGIRFRPFFHHVVSLGENAPERAYIHTQHIFGSVGTAPVYRREALEDCAVVLDGEKEYFDEDFFMYKEDVDLAYRLRWRGWRALCVTDARAYHIRTAKSASFLWGRTRPEKVNEWSYRNHFFVLMKNLSIRMLLRYFPGIILYECAKALYHVVRAPQTFFSALKDVYRMSGRMMKKRAIIFSRRTITDIQMLSAMTKTGSPGQARG